MVTNANRQMSILLVGFHSNICQGKSSILEMKDGTKEKDYTNDYEIYGLIEVGSTASEI